MDQIKSLRDVDFKFKKRLGQNFLINESILNEIVDLSNIEKGSLIIEIGCGAGSLTNILINKGLRVIGYEIDKSLSPILDNMVKNNENLHIIYDDFLSRNLIDDISSYKYEKLYIMGNIPYYITTPIIEKIMNSKVDFYKVILMVQKEVGNRITASINTKDYNSLSVFLNYNYNLKKILKVDKNSFVPKPKVDSVVVEITQKNEKDAVDEKHFYKLVRDSFKQKRKTLKNNLREYDYAKVMEILAKYGFDEKVRAEQININIFVELSNYLVKNKCWFILLTSVYYKYIGQWKGEDILENNISKCS